MLGTIKTIYRRYSIVLQCANVCCLSKECSKSIFHRIVDTPLHYMRILGRFRAAPCLLIWQKVLLFEAKMLHSHTQTHTHIYVKLWRHIKSVIWAMAMVFTATSNCHYTTCNNDNNHNDENTGHKVLSGGWSGNICTWNGTCQVRRCKSTVATRKKIIETEMREE